MEKEVSEPRRVTLNTNASVLLLDDIAKVPLTEELACVRDCVSVVLEIRLFD